MARLRDVLRPGRPAPGISAEQLRGINLLTECTRAHKQSARR